MAVITMTREEREAFLAGVHVGVVCIADGDRAPIAAPIWYDYAPGGDLRIVTGRDSRKGKRLVPGAKVSLCAQQEAPPYKYVTVEGVVAAVETANVERDVRPV